MALQVIQGSFWDLLALLSNHSWECLGSWGTARAKEAFRVQGGEPRTVSYGIQTCGFYLAFP